MYRLVAAGLFLAAACTTATIGDPATGSPPAELELTQHDPTTIAGTFAHAGAVVSFETHLVGPDHATLRLDVNGAVFTVDADLPAGAMREDGGLNALYREDLDALVALRDALMARDATIVDGFHGKLLVKHLDHLAEAPTGHTFDRVDVAMPAAATRDRSGSCGDDGLTCLPGENGWAYSYHDATTHGCNAYWWPYGNDAPDCEGRCGAGCSFWDHDYMQDCFDHDVCLDYHGGSSFGGNPDCGDEYDEAYDDYWATFGSLC